MATRIRLARGGSKKRPFYRIVVSDKRSPRDGNFIEKIGTYNPLAAKDSAERFVLDAERAKHWIAKGATASDKVQSYFIKLGLVQETAKAKALKAKATAKVKAIKDAEAAAKQAEADAKAAEEAAKAAAEAAAATPAEEAPAA